MDHDSSNFISLNDIPESSWEKLSNKRILFGHQSVGWNIIEGLNDVLKDNPQIKLRIIETKNSSDFIEQIFGHFEVGENKNIKSKIDDFISRIEGGYGDKVDIALFKLCYVDIDESADVLKIFQQYQNTIEKLKNKYPNIIFVSTTTPLTTKSNKFIDKLKYWVKLLIGRPVDRIENNKRREEFNNLIRSEYQGQGTVFDLAAIESAYPDGRRSKISIDGIDYPSLNPNYTDDGGHLNRLGKRVVATQLLLFLAKIVN